MSHCCVVAFCPSLTGNTTSPTSHTSLRNLQNPHPVCCGIACFEPRFASWREISQHTPGGGYLPMFAHTRRRFKSSVLRYLDFRPGLRPDLRDIAAQYSTDLIKGAEHRRVRDIHPLSSGASHVPVLPPAPRTPRPLEHQEHQGPWGPPCVLRYWGFGASFQPIFLENAAHTTQPQRSTAPPCREGRRRQAANHTRTSVCAAISGFSAGFEAGFARYRSTVLNRPTKSAPSTPHQHFKNAALSEPTPNISVVCCVLLKKSGDLEANTQISQHARRAGAGQGEPR